MLPGAHLPINRRVLLVSLALTLLILAACQRGDDDDAATTQPSGEYTLDLITDGFNEPVGVTALPGDGSRLLVLEQDGVVRLVIDGVVQDAPYLDLRERVTSSANEQGLLGIAPDPVFAENGRIYLYFTAAEDGANTLVRLTVDPAATSIDAASLEVLLAIPDDRGNHNGGMLAFDPDGYLFVGTGDGGGGNAENSQRLDTLLGKLLRLDVSGERGYIVPATNPLVGRDGLDEIWALGLRNPWRFSIDASDRRVLIGDVGATSWEEVNVVSLDPPGVPGTPDEPYNFGWPLIEGDACRDASACDDSFIAPIHTYGRDLGCAITGGYVYRGSALSELQGHYVFSDFCMSDLRVLAPGDAASTWAETHQVLVETSLSIASFGEDAQGELLILDRAGGALYRLGRADTP